MPEDKAVDCMSVMQNVMDGFSRAKTRKCSPERAIRMGDATYFASLRLQTGGMKCADSAHLSAVAVHFRLNDRPVPFEPIS